MKIAIPIKDIAQSRGVRNTKFEISKIIKQTVYKMEPPLKGYGDDAKEHSLVLVSANNVMGELETYLFGCDEDGKVIDWGELPGSMKGDVTHQEALYYSQNNVQSWSV